MDITKLESTKLRNLTVVAAQNQLFSDLDGEAVILNLKTGVYHGLDAVGAKIWHLLQETRSVDDILKTLLEEYEVEPDRCMQELSVLLQELADQKLIEVRSEATA